MTMFNAGLLSVCRCHSQFLANNDFMIYFLCFSIFPFKVNGDGARLSLKQILFFGAIDFVMKYHAT